VRDLIAGVVFFCVLASPAFAQAPAAKALGSVKSTSGNSFVLTADSGTETTVTISDSARILRTSPGQTNLKTAMPISAADIQVGDRVLARGQAGDNGTLVASSVIVMTKSDIAQRQQQERDEWRKGVGGIVKSVDASAGTVTLANSLLASGKPIVVHVSQDTSIHRYAPDSVKFDEAKPGTLDQIKAGDQLRARGTKSADGTEFPAQAIVSGSFRDIAGTVISTDAATNSVSVMDLASKEPVTVKVSFETQLHKLPPMIAQMLAFRLKGGTQAGMQSGTPGAAGIQRGAQDGTAAPTSAPGNFGGGQGNWNRGGAPGASASGGQGNWRGGSGGPPDVQQMLSRTPEIRIADLNKGDAVMLVATEGTASTIPTIITLVAGVEPLLSAAPAGTSASTLLSPWNLGTQTGAGGGDTAPQ
jgi:hypothetical protein